MRKLIPLIAVLWGGAVLVNHFFFVKGTVAASGVHAAGGEAATIFGGLMFVVGLFYLFRRAS